MSLCSRTWLHLRFDFSKLAKCRNWVRIKCLRCKAREGASCCALHLVATTQTGLSSTQSAYRRSCVSALCRACTIVVFKVLNVILDDAQVCAIFLGGFSVFSRVEVNILNAAGPLQKYKTGASCIVIFHIVFITADFNLSRASYTVSWVANFLCLIVNRRPLWTKVGNIFHWWTMVYIVSFVN